MVGKVLANLVLIDSDIVSNNSNDLLTAISLQETLINSDRMTQGLDQSKCYKCLVFVYIKFEIYKK